MIRYLNNRRLAAVWIYAAIIAILNLISLVVAPLVSVPINWPSLLLVEGTVIGHAIICFVLYMDYVFPRRQHRRLSLYLVDTSALEIESRLEDLVRVGIFEKHEQEGGALYTDTGYKEKNTAISMKWRACMRAACSGWVVPS